MSTPTAACASKVDLAQHSTERDIQLPSNLSRAARSSVPPPKVAPIQRDSTPQGQEAAATSIRASRPPIHGQSNLSRSVVTASHARERSPRDMTLSNDRPVTAQSNAYFSEIDDAAFDGVDLNPASYEQHDSTVPLPVIPNRSARHNQPSNSLLEEP